MQPGHTVRRSQSCGSNGIWTGSRTTISARPTCRNATAYGLSPYLRVDLVVNSLVGYAYTTGRS